MLAELRGEDRDICAYAQTEMVNNAIDHAEASQVTVDVVRYAPCVELRIEDDGVGIFQKIATALNLEHPRRALLELSKGKFTTDPRRHTGEGLFFTSRMFDRFELAANGLVLRRVDGAISVSEVPSDSPGTLVVCQLLVPTDRSMTEVFSEYSSGPDDYRFARTVVPIALATFGDDSLISRSSARRVLARIDRFDEVVLDYRSVRIIGQAFADEIYRVFQADHPNLSISSVNAIGPIQQMISRAKSALRAQ